MAETKTTIPVEIKMGNAGTNDANLPAFKEGSIIFTKDTKKIYIDPVGETERIAVGGGDNSNISNDSATASLKQKQDDSYAGIKIKTKNPSAYNLDNTLTDAETIGSLGNFSSSFGGNTQAKGKRAFATGTGTIAKGGYSFASGSDSVALGSASHVEGYKNTTGPNADSSHAEGGENIVTSNRGHAEGYMNTVSGENGHAEGGKNDVSGENGHAEGLGNIASGKYSHAEGQSTMAQGNQSHTEGAKTKALGSASHVEGDTNEAHSYAAHIEGSGNKILATIGSSDTPGTGSGGSPIDPNFKIDEHRGDNSHVEGAQNLMYGYTAHAEGTKNVVKGHYAHAEGINNTITIDAEASHVEGNSNNVTSKYSHTEGYNNTNNGLHAHVEGYNNTTKSQSTHIEGESNTIENSIWAHVEGCNNSVSDGASAAHVEGSNNDARGVSAHAEGASTRAWGKQSHSGGYDSIAGGDYSFVHGISSSATGEASVAFGRNNSAYSDQFVIGKYAKTYDDPNDTKIPYEYFAIGNGDSSTRKNAFTVYRDGHAEVQKQGTTNNSVVIKKTLDTELDKKQDDLRLTFESGAIKGAYSFYAENLFVNQALSTNYIFSDKPGRSTGLKIDGTNSKIQLFDSDLSSPITLTGIKAGTADTDAVNVSQLKGKQNDLGLTAKSTDNDISISNIAKTKIICDKKITIGSNAGLIDGTIHDSSALKEGSIYEFTLIDTVYSNLTLAEDLTDNGEYYIGNGHILDTTIEDTGEPFVVVSAEGDQFNLVLRLNTTQYDQQQIYTKLTETYYDGTLELGTNTENGSFIKFSTGKASRNDQMVVGKEKVGYIQFKNHYGRDFPIQDDYVHIFGVADPIAKEDLTESELSDVTAMINRSTLGRQAANVNYVDGTVNNLNDELKNMYIAFQGDKLYYTSDSSNRNRTPMVIAPIKIDGTKTLRPNFIEIGYDWLNTMNGTADTVDGGTSVTDNYNYPNILMDKMNLILSNSAIFRNGEATASNTLSNAAIALDGTNIRLMQKSYNTTPTKTDTVYKITGSPAPLLGVATPLSAANTTLGITADDLPYQAVNKKYVDDIKTELLNAITHPYTYDEDTKELTLIL